MLQRQVQIEAQPRALAGLVRVAAEEREIGVGVGVDRDGQDVGASVEDPLGAVAMVHVDIQYGDPLRAAAH